MAVRIFRSYWQLPMVLLAGAELVLFAGAFYLAALWRFDGDTRQVAAVASGGIFFCVMMSLSMASMGLYSARQTARPAGLFIRIGTAVVCATSLMAIVSYVAPSLYFGRGVMLLCMAMNTIGSLACHL